MTQAPGKRIDEEQSVKDITLSADEHVIKLARERAARERTTLNAKFQEWLEDYSKGKQQREDAMAVIDEISRTARTGGRKFTRDEMNER